MDWADSAMRRVVEHQTRETVFHTLPCSEGEQGTYLEKKHPLLNRPRLCVWIHTKMPLGEVRQMFATRGHNHLFDGWMQATGVRLYGKTHNDDSLPKFV